MPDAEKISSSASSGAGPAARRRSPRRKPAAAQRPVRRRKTTRARRSRLSALLSGLSRQAARAGKQIAVIGEEGISGARRTYGKAEIASKKAVARITREWKGMDNRRRAQFVAALLAALAAASAPIVRSQLKKR